ncbi:MAG: transcription termination factor NusA [Spirochaetia bacterium]
MGTHIADSVVQLQQEKGISEELVLKMIEETLIAAYKRRFGSNDNAIVKFSEDHHYVYLYSQKQIVEDDDWDDPLIHIEVSEARKLNAEAEVGDEILIEVDPKEFDRISVQTAKQRAHQDLRDIQKDIIYSEFKDKRGEIIIGYYQREQNGNIFVNLGRTEGILPKRFQSPREVYRPGDRIKALIWEVKREGMLSIVLSRTHTEFVRRLLELEVPEIYDGTVEIRSIVREPGFRIKLAVASTRDDMDPVGACVGVKGQRIQGIVRELEGEKIDILRYDENPKNFIKNSLSPARVNEVYILDREKKQALAVLEESQLSLAIGKQGLNVRLANRLVDWSIDVKTEEQFAEMDVVCDDSQHVNDLFASHHNDGEEITHISEMPNIPARIVSVLQENGIELIEVLVNMERETLMGLNGMTTSDADTLISLLKDNLEIFENQIEPIAEQQEGLVDDTENEGYTCPECGAAISLDMSECPNCGVEFSFEEE